MTLDTSVNEGIGFFGFHFSACVEQRMRNKPHLKCPIKHLCGKQMEMLYPTSLVEKIKSGYLKHFASNKLGRSSVLLSTCKKLT